MEGYKSVGFLQLRKNYLFPIIQKISVICIFQSSLFRLIINYRVAFAKGTVALIYVKTCQNGNDQGKSITRVKIILKL